MNEQIKSAVMQTYKTKIESLTGKKPLSILFSYRPVISDEIIVTIKIENSHDLEDLASSKDSRFLKRLIVPKLQKELKKKYKTRTIKFELISCLIEFETNKITLFAEFVYSERKDFLTYLKAI
jgi:hypothetical protein